MKLNTKKDSQLKLNIGSRTDELIGHFKKAEQRISQRPYWVSEWTWLGILVPLFFGGYSISRIAHHFEELPSEIALYFVESTSTDVLKDKYLLYFLPISLILVSLIVSFLESKFHHEFTRFTRLTTMFMIAMSCIQLLLVNKIISIYI